MPADYDGDGSADIAVFMGRSGDDWYYWSSSNQSLVETDFGYSGVVPVQADYDGDGRTDLAVFDPAIARWYIVRSSLGYIQKDYGWNGPIPVPTDYKGDGKADLALYNPPDGKWYRWYWNGGYQTTVQFGGPSAEPVPGDYDGDGKADLAVRGPNSLWSLLQTSAGFTTYSFGW